MKAIIVANGTLSRDMAIQSLLADADLVIAADGGAVHLQRLGVSPDIIIGDLDSISDDALASFKSEQIPMAAHPARKDQTDTELCIDYALAQGCREILFLGVTGNRLDHTLANIFLLRRLADQGITARITDAHNDIYLVLSDLVLKGVPGDLLSVIPVSDRVTGLTLTGLEYPLTDKTLHMGTALGVSNCFTGHEATVHIDSGAVIVTKSRD